jgi:hypothetical protein
MGDSIVKSQHSWMIIDKMGGKRVTNQRPTRWDADKGVEPKPHEVQWDETAYSMTASIMSPEEIDGPMVKVNDEPLESWEELTAPHPLDVKRWMAQEIFRRIQRIVPRGSYGPSTPMKSSCIGHTVNIELGQHGAFIIKVESL